MHEQKVIDWNAGFIYEFIMSRRQWKGGGDGYFRSLRPRLQFVRIFKGE